MDHPVAHAQNASGDRIAMSFQSDDSTPLVGLSEAEVLLRQQAEGFNEIPHAANRGVFAITLEVMREPMFLLLVACGGLYLLMGELSDALMLMGFVFVVMGITIVQERRTERALGALRDLSSPRALVLRDGKQRHQRKEHAPERLGSPGQEAKGGSGITDISDIEKPVDNRKRFMKLER